MALGIHLHHVRLPLVAITQNDFLYDWLCISLSFDDASIHGGLLTFVYAELSWSLLKSGLWLGDCITLTGQTGLTFDSWIV